MYKFELNKLDEMYCGQSQFQLSVTKADCVASNQLMLSR